MLYAGRPTGEREFDGIHPRAWTRSEDSGEREIPGRRDAIARGLPKRLEMAGPETYPGVLLSVQNAARLAHASEGTIWQSIATGELPSVCRTGRSGTGQEVDVWLVPLDRLRSTFAGRGDLPPLARDGQPEDPRRVRALLERVARLEGELAAAERCERAANRYSDRLEDRVEQLEETLAGERRRALLLARAIGRLESERDDLATALERARTLELPATTDHGPSRPARRRRWGRRVPRA